MFSPTEYTERLARLRRMMREKSLDLVILNVNTDLYYYSGSMQPLYLMVPHVGEPVALARKSIARSREEAVTATLEPFLGTKELTRIITDHQFAGATRIGMTLDVTAYATVTRLHKLFASAEIVDCSWEIRQLRMVKSPAEIAIVARGGQMLARVPEVARAAFHPGITELELTAECERDFRRHGHGAVIRCRREGIEMAAFGVCSAGVNSMAGSKFDGICGGVGVSPATPFGASTDPISRGMPVVLDFAFVLEGYHIDQTRMLCWGEPPTEVRQAYTDMLAVQHGVFAALRSGVAWEVVYAGAVEHAARLGYADTFMGIGPERVRFVGHGVGLELDEPPFLAPGMPDVLAPGMVMAIEPKVALPGLGVVGIEDTVVLCEDGPERLTVCEQEMIIV